MTELLTVAMAAERCHVHAKTIERAIRNEELRASRLASRGCWVIQPDDLQAWVDARANRPRGQQPTARPIDPNCSPAQPRRRRSTHDGRLVVTPGMGRTA